jgi:hypothetical protein
MPSSQRRTQIEPLKINYETAQSLSVRYAELLRLRQEVHQAEAQSSFTQGTPPVISSRIRKNRVVIGRSH